MNTVSVAAAYRFVDIAVGSAPRQRLFASAQATGLKGTLLLAPEGHNFTLTGGPAALQGGPAALQATRGSRRSNSSNTPPPSCPTSTCASRSSEKSSA